MLERFKPGSIDGCAKVKIFVLQTEVNERVSYAVQKSGAQTPAIRPNLYFKRSHHQTLPYAALLKS
jgi:hypothetical protein